jgi:molecular chaperone Hsp33
MTSGEKHKSVPINVYSDPKHEAVIARGDFSDFFEVFYQHIDRWSIPLDGLTITMMRQGLAALALHLACRPRDQVDAITLNVNKPPINIFLCGDNVDSMVTGRAFTNDVKTEHSSRFFVESHRPGFEPTKSVVEVAGLDVLVIFEQYYSKSEQTHARFFEYDNNEYMLVLGLPSIDLEWLTSLDRDSAYKLADSGLQIIAEHIYDFQCGCDPEKIIKATKNIFENNPDELFGKNTKIETFCPRCGRRWWIAREDFETGHGKVGVS